MAIKVWLTEEYGYREWLWLHPGDIDDVVADWKVGRIPPCVHVYQYGCHDRKDDFHGTCEEWDPKLIYWQKLEVEVQGKDERDPFVHGAIDLYQRLTHDQELCREHGVIVRGHCHEWDDTRLVAMGVVYPAWWTPVPGIDDRF